MSHDRSFKSRKLILYTTRTSSTRNRLHPAPGRADSRLPFIAGSGVDASKETAGAPLWFACCWPVDQRNSGNGRTKPCCNRKCECLAKEDDAQDHADPRTQKALACDAHRPKRSHQPEIDQKRDTGAEDRQDRRCRKCHRAGVQCPWSIQQQSKRDEHDRRPDHRAGGCGDSTDMGEAL